MKTTTLLRNLYTLLILTFCTVGFSQNIALNKPTNQSSTWYGAVASKAVDGITTGNYANVSHTQSETIMWWKVDLGATYAINQIKVYNRTDARSERIIGVQVYAGNTNSTNPADYAAVGSPLVNQPVNNLTGLSATGRYVMLYLVRPSTDEVLAFAEVEVFGTVPDTTSNTDTTTNTNTGTNSGGTTTTTGISLWEKNGTAIHYNTGNVGIGTTALPTYKLAVDGHIRAREIKVDIDTWADYVFTPSYKLPSLATVQEHINKYGHLPNIPAAAEIEANGLDLGAMNTLLLKKIEELTLYTLAQEKALEAIRLELKKVK